MAQIESLLAGNFMIHLLEDKLRKGKKPPSEMSVAEILQFFRDTMDLVENRMTAQEFGAKYGI
jgi:hypothetical protein